MGTMKALMGMGTMKALTGMGTMKALTGHGHDESAHGPAADMQRCWGHDAHAGMPSAARTRLKSVSRRLLLAFRRHNLRTVLSLQSVRSRAMQRAKRRAYHEQLCTWS